MIGGIGYGALVAMFCAGLATGLALRGGESRKRPARPLSEAESPEQSLARLSGGYQGTRPSTALRPPRPVRSVNMPKGSGFAPGPQPRVRPIRPADMPTRGTTGGAGQAYGGPTCGPVGPSGQARAH